MVLTRSAVTNRDLIKNLPSSMREELIYLDDVIPDGIMSALYHNNPVYKKERENFLDNHPNIIDKMFSTRLRREYLAEKEENESPVSSRINVETDEKIEFIKKYPQFKQLIECVKFRDENRNIIMVVPIDQYLEKY